MALGHPSTLTIPTQPTTTYHHYYYIPHSNQDTCNKQHGLKDMKTRHLCLFGTGSFGTCVGPLHVISFLHFWHFLWHLFAFVCMCWAGRDSILLPHSVYYPSPPKHHFCGRTISSMFSCLPLSPFYCLPYNITFSCVLYLSSCAHAPSPRQKLFTSSYLSLPTPHRFYAYMLPFLVLFLPKHLLPIYTTTCMHETFSPIE